MPRRKPIIPKSRSKKHSEVNREVKRIHNRTTHKGRIYKSEEDLGDFEVITQHPYYNRLNYRQKTFLFEHFIQPITEKTNIEIYYDCYGKDKKCFRKENRTPLTRKPIYNYSLYNQIARSEKISTLLKLIKKEHNKIFNITSERIMREEAIIAFSDLPKYIDKNGYLNTNPEDLPPQIRRAIKDITTIQRKDGSVSHKVTLWSKSQALNRIENMLNMQNNNNSININTQINNNPQSQYDFTLLSYDEKKQLSAILKKCKVDNKPQIIDV